MAPTKTDQTADPATFGADYSDSPINSQTLATADLLQDMAEKDPKAVAAAARGYALAMSQALALQDAVAHLRRTQILAETATSLGMQKMAQDQLQAGQAIIDAARAALADAQAAVAAAEKALA